MLKDALDQHAGVQPVNTQTQLSHQETNTQKHAGYDSIKMRYLRSLNIPIPTTKKTDEWESDTIASSAPIPIPKPPISTTLSDSEDEEDSDSSYDTPPKASSTRKRRSTTGTNKFIPPHEMISMGNNTDNAATTINHSLPTNYRRRNHIGI